ncbi:MAG TPA: mycofactocin biosynthesis peptidyl-dipeptidase MftE [Acidimicrobiales bacterium]
MSQLGQQTWPEAAARRPLLLLPLGSCEQHGPHLPLDTDTRIAVAVADDAARRGPDLIVAPAVAYGASGEHAGFAGTLSVGLAALEHVVVELVRSAAHFRGVALVNGHGGNARAVEGAVRTLRLEGRTVLAWFPRVPDGDAHAGRTETSLMLAIAPELVHLDRAEAGCPSPLAELLPILESGGVRAVSANGVLGDPAGATGAEGRALLGALATDLTEAIAAWGV